MLMLVSGGAASGKSQLAESAALALGSRCVYLATMKRADEESLSRIERHRAMRAGKGFETLECPTGLSGVEVPAQSAVLLECLSNLAANELFDPSGAKDGAFDAILGGIDRLLSRCSHLIVVTNEVFSDGVSYDEGTTRYLRLLADLNCAVAKRADRVAEAVCGISIFHKGGPI